MSRYNVGDRVSLKSNWPSHGLNKGDIGTVVAPEDNQRYEVVNVLWDSRPVSVLFHQDYLLPSNEARKIKATVVTDKGTSDFEQKPGWIDEMVALGVLYHTGTTVFNDYAVKHYSSSAPLPYYVEDKRVNADLWSLYPQEK